MGNFINRTNIVLFTRILFCFGNKCQSDHQIGIQNAFGLKFFIANDRVEASNELYFICYLSFVRSERKLSYNFEIRKERKEKGKRKENCKKKSNKK